MMKKNSQWSIIIVFIVLVLAMGLAESLLRDHPVFFKPANLSNILLQTSINTIIAVGMTLIIITAGIDLSVGSLLALCNVVMGLTMLHVGAELASFQIILGCLMAIVAGSTVGWFNGSVSHRWNIPPFIVTLGMLGVARGLALWLIDSQTENLIGQVPAGFFALGNQTLLGIPISAWIALIVVGAGHVILNYTPLGRYAIAIGANEQAAHLAGIRVGRIKVLIYTLGGLLVGVAAIIQTSRLGSANPTIGAGFELFAIAAVIIGGTSLMGGRGTIIGTLVGALIIGVLNNGLTLLNIPDEIKQIVIGLVIILAVLIDRIRQNAKGAS